MIAVLVTAACMLGAHGQLPDTVCSPGVVLPQVTQSNVATTICMAGWAREHRDVSYATRRRVYISYGLPGPHPFPEWELDHRVPLELAGSNAQANLWPEHGPAGKDRLENQLHARVCAHTMRLRTAQRVFMGDWRRLLP